MVQKTFIFSTAFFFLLFFLPVNSSLAFEQSVKSSEGVLIAQPIGPVASANTIALAPTTKEELLLFWEEKDLYVETATRYGKPISQVAENMTVITAKDIEDMNAHTVEEVLNRVSGISVDLTLDFGSAGFFHIQGSEPRHVLVLIDGITINKMAEGMAVANFVPVRTIERIEIIKGPGSSAWGSSLGGVINIITKAVGDTKRPSGTLNASYGERDTQDDSAELSGKVKGIGYYLFAGHRDSDGLKSDKYFRTDDLYAKVNVPLGKNVSFGLTAGYSEPHLSYGDLHLEPPLSPLIYDITSKEIDREFFVTAHLDAELTKELKFKTSFYVFEQKQGRTDNLYLPTILPNTVFRTTLFNWKEKTVGGSARLVYTHGMHAAVLGADVSHGTLDQSSQRNQMGALMTSATTPELDKWAIYLNDTITINKLSITPGIRYDHNNISGSFTSPSLGATYKLAERTIARASVARGFTLPPLGWSTGSGLFMEPNPDLKMENVWSYQGGIETGLTDYIWLKLTVFEHDMKDEIVDGPTDVNGFSKNINKGEVKRTGYEVEAETAPFYSLSLKTGFASARIAPEEEGGTPRDTNSYNIALKYDDKKSLMAQLFGNYVWWNLAADQGARYNTFVWDFNLTKKIFSTDRTTTEVYAAVHNLFNASYFTTNIYPNPQRWAEAGIRFKF